MSRHSRCIGRGGRSSLLRVVQAHLHPRRVCCLASSPRSARVRAECTAVSAVTTALVSTRPVLPGPIAQSVGMSGRRRSMDTWPASDRHLVGPLREHDASGTEWEESRRAGLVAEMAGGFPWPSWRPCPGEALRRPADIRVQVGADVGSAASVFAVPWLVEVLIGGCSAVAARI